MTNYILLTDDLYLLLGLREITQYSFIHVNYNGEGMRDVNISSKTCVVIDNRMFLCGGCCGYEKIKKNIIGNICYIWLDMLKDGCIYPVDSENDLYLSFESTQKISPRKIKKNLCMFQKKRKTLLAMNKHPYLTKRELEISRHLLENKDIHEIKIIFKLKEKTIRFHIKSIITKFGFKRLSHFVSFCKKNKGMVNKVLKIP
ncbi:helix-turn-helix transcriptional regulator [Klebsiella pneumoniae]